MCPQQCVHVRYHLKIQVLTLCASTSLCLYTYYCSLVLKPVFRGCGIFPTFLKLLRSYRKDDYDGTNVSQVLKACCLSGDLSC